VVTEAQKDVGVIGTAGDVKSCTGCLASISSTGTVVTQQFGTNQSDGSATASADDGVLKTFATASSNGHYGYWSKSYIPLAVPEPNACVLVLAGLCAVGFLLRRR
jgi:PEP-CTERM motif-containing protein